MWRDVYRLVLNPEVFIDPDNLRELVIQAGFVRAGSDNTNVAASISATAERLEKTAAACEARMNSLLQAAKNEDDLRRLRQALLAHTTPLALSLGVWLQGASMPKNFEDRTQLKVLALLADDIGVGRAEASRADAFRQVLRQHDLAVHASGSRDLASNPSLRDGVFRLPAVLFALSRQSEVFREEIAGLDLALRLVGIMPQWRLLSRLVPATEWQCLNLAARQSDALPDGQSPLDLSWWVAEQYGENEESLLRVLRGMEWIIEALPAEVDELEGVAAAVVDPALAMALLIGERAREAAVYHQGFALEGKSLDRWFAEATDDPYAFLAVLARSKLVRPGNPGRSPLLGPMLGPNGQMFRIFRPEDVETIGRWISSLERPDEEKEAKSSCGRQWTPPRLHRRPITTGDSEHGPVPSGIREAYHLLQGRSLAPRTREFAVDYTNFWLSAARRSLEVTDRSIPASWQPGQLRTWLLHAHGKHDATFRESDQEPLPSREELIDQTLQLAPLTLIDGAWIQGFTEVAYASSRVGAPLFQTYWDELGNGDWSINHPKIYRDLLISMGYDLAPTGTKAFSRDPKIREASFRLPVFWLCLGKMPVSLRPEILGLNLAMELSGVGGSYRSARRFLKHHNFSTQFVDLHNTIDNVSTGHSAWAAAAIDAHMLAASEFADLEREWHRVRTGYEALSPISKRDSDLDFFRSWKRFIQPKVKEQSLA